MRKQTEQEEKFRFTSLLIIEVIIRLVALKYNHPLHIAAFLSHTQYAADFSG